MTRSDAPFSHLLHELAERLQATGAYLGAARRMSHRSQPPPQADLIGRAAEELARAQAAFHALRAELSVYELPAASRDRNACRPSKSAPRQGGVT